MRAALSAMLSDAADDRIIMANPAFQVGRHKTNRTDKLTSAERVQKVRPMTREQRDAFLEAASGEKRYPTPFAVLARAGLRPGEVFALEPGDIDWGETTRGPRTTGGDASVAQGVAAGLARQRAVERLDHASHCGAQSGAPDVWRLIR
jgi:integrase